MKEVIFHFFPSARFLGLSLKILFHKNKEIKRMLSKKMTFSLMSLITLLAFAFVAPVATAGILGDKFVTTITLEPGQGTEGENSVTARGMLVGDNQITTGSDATRIRVVFAKAVTAGENAVAATDGGPAEIPAGRFAPEDVTIVAFNKLTGAVVGVTVATGGIAAAFTDSTTEYIVTLSRIAVTAADGQDDRRK